MMSCSPWRPAINMTDFETFDYFQTGGIRDYILRGSSTWSLSVVHPTYANFRTPPLRDGDTFDFRRALEIQPELALDTLASGVSNVEVIKLSRGVLMDAGLVLYATDPQGLTYYQGKPPRGNYGSLVEGLQTYEARHTYINYERQRLGRRVILLDMDPFDTVWGSLRAGITEYDDDGDPQQVISEFNLNDVSLYTGELMDTIKIHSPSGWWNSNADADPPLPPSVDPLEFVIEGTMILDYGALIGYTRPQTGTLPPVQLYALMTGKTFGVMTPAGPEPLMDTSEV